MRMNIRVRIYAYVRMNSLTDVLIPATLTVLYTKDCRCHSASCFLALHVAGGGGKCVAHTAQEERPVKIAVP